MPRASTVRMHIPSDEGYDAEVDGPVIKPPTFVYNPIRLTPPPRKRKTEPPPIEHRSKRGKTGQGMCRNCGLPKK